MGWMQVMMEPTVPPQCPHTTHTHHFAKQVSVEVPPRLCGVTKVLAHHSVHQQSHQFGVPPITVSLVCVCQMWC